MTPAAWTAEVCRRIGINEGRRKFMYLDSVGIPTIGVGFNLQRADARAALAKAGVRDVDGVIAGRTPLTDAQIDALFAYSLAPILTEARASLQPGHFDLLSEARRFVLCDLVFNLGAAGWQQFGATRALLDQAVHAKATGQVDAAHAAFVAAGDHVAASLVPQVCDRARRNAAILRSGEWVDAYGDGTR